MSPVGTIRAIGVQNPSVDVKATTRSLNRREIMLCQRRGEGLISCLSKLIGHYRNGIFTFWYPVVGMLRKLAAQNVHLVLVGDVESRALSPIPVKQAIFSLASNRNIFRVTDMVIPNPGAVLRFQSCLGNVGSSLRLPSHPVGSLRLGESTFRKGLGVRCLRGCRSGGCLGSSSSDVLLLELASDKVQHFIGLPSRIVHLGVLKVSDTRNDYCENSDYPVRSGGIPPDPPEDRSPKIWPLRLGGFLCVGLGFFSLQFLAYGSLRSDNGKAFFLFILLGGFLVWLGFHLFNLGDKRLHENVIVAQKPLTHDSLCATLIAVGRQNPMANVLAKDKQIAVISALAEGSSIRSIERITGINRNTIMTLGMRVGKGCAALMDAKMRNLQCHYLQLDEIWGFIGKKERHLRVDDDPQYGDVWTFCAIDAETKLVPAFRCGRRDMATAKAFVGDLAGRLATRVQISSDALRAYRDSIEQTFGTDVDFGQIIKTYEHDYSQHPELKYSAPKFVAVEKRPIIGNPDMDLVSTSYIERLNATTRLHMRRLTRLTLAFSKKRENFEAAVALHFAYYNFVRRHNTLRCTPAMEAGIEPSFWSVGDLLEAVA